MRERLKSLVFKSNDMTWTIVSRPEVNGTYTQTPLPWSTPAPHVLNGMTQSRPALLGANVRGCVVTFESESLCNHSRCKHVYTTEGASKLSPALLSSDSLASSRRIADVGSERVSRAVCTQWTMSSKWSSSHSMTHPTSERIYRASLNRATWLHKVGQNSGLWKSKKA